MPLTPVERNNMSEPNAEAFIFGFEFHSGQRPRQIAWPEVREIAAAASTGWRWLHFNRLAGATETWLEERSGLDETVISALLQNETRPRCVAHGEGLLLNLRGVNYNPGAEPEDMISVRIWATGSLIVSMRSYPVRAVQEIREDVAHSDSPLTPGGLLVRICAQLVDNMDPIVEQLRDDADQYEEQLLSPNARLPRNALAEFRGAILLLRRYIQPQKEAVAQLLRENSSLIDASQAILLREAGDHITRISEELDTIRERAAVLQDQVAGHRQEILNRRLLALSIVSSVFLPLTFLTGLLGMNVAGIPFAGEAWAFPIIVILLTMVAGSLLGVLKLLRWM
jgi:zinc transporter